jgi:hypothetical protein
MPKRKHADSSRSLEKILQTLDSCDRDELLRHWKQFYTESPPAFLSKPLLVKAIAYRLQENQHGGLSASAKRLLFKAAENPSTITKPLANISPGTRLVREWHGKVYEVIVAHDGVLLDGMHLRSLSEAAYRITGSKWSGPRFFGLVKGG